MKKVLFLACLLAATFCAQAQTGSLVIRNGNHYAVEGQSLDKKGFMNYLQAHDQVIYQDFSRAYKLSNTGWGLFGAGLGVGTIGLGVMIGEAAKVAAEAQKENITPNQAAKEVAAGVFVGQMLLFVGSAVNLSGIICLGVGYGRMHRSADLYNIQVQQKYKAQLSFTGNGLALAW